MEYAASFIDNFLVGIKTHLSSSTVLSLFAEGSIGLIAIQCYS